MTTAEFIKKVSYHALGWGVECGEATYDIARLALERGIPGDFVECGVYAGASSALIARAIVDYHEQDISARSYFKEGVTAADVTPRRVHLFDSFQGMPEPGSEDAEIMTSYGEKCKGSTCCPLSQVEEKMHEWGIPSGLLVYHHGWFEQTIPAADIKSIAVLRIDCDLYEPTKLVMKHLFPLVPRGGWIIADDYDLSGERLAVNEVVNPAPMYWRKR